MAKSMKKKASKSSKKKMMKKKYGTKKGKQIFYATERKGKIKGIKKIK